MKFFWWGVFCVPVKKKRNRRSLVKPVAVDASVPEKPKKHVHWSTASPIVIQPALSQASDGETRCTEPVEGTRLSLTQPKKHIQAPSSGPVGPPLAQDAFIRFFSPSSKLVSPALFRACFDVYMLLTHGCGGKIPLGELMACNTFASSVVEPNTQRVNAESFTFDEFVSVMVGHEPSTPLFRTPFSSMSSKRSHSIQISGTGDEDAQSRIHRTLFEVLDRNHNSHVDSEETELLVTIDPLLHRIIIEAIKQQYIPVPLDFHHFTQAMQQYEHIMELRYLRTLKQLQPPYVAMSEQVSNAMCEFARLNETKVELNLLRLVHLFDDVVVGALEPKRPVPSPVTETPAPPSASLPPLDSPVHFSVISSMEVHTATASAGKPSSDSTLPRDMDLNNTNSEPQQTQPNITKADTMAPLPANTAVVTQSTPLKRQRPQASAPFTKSDLRARSSIIVKPFQLTTGDLEFYHTLLWYTVFNGSNSLEPSQLTALMSRHKAHNIVSHFFLSHISTFPPPTIVVTSDVGERLTLQDIAVKSVFRIFDSKEARSFVRSLPPELLDKYDKVFSFLDEDESGTLNAIDLTTAVDDMVRGGVDSKELTSLNKLVEALPRYGGEMDFGAFVALFEQECKDIEFYNDIIVPNDDSAVDDATDNTSDDEDQNDREESME
jgi:hypothetical protein